MKKKEIHIILSLTLLILCLAGFSYAQQEMTAKQPGILEDILISKAQNYLEVDILIKPYTSHIIFDLYQPNRLVIEFFNVGFSQTDSFFDVSDFGVQAIRVGLHENAVTRVVFDVIDQFPSYEVERTPDGLKVLFQGEGKEKEIMQVEELDEPVIEKEEGLGESEKIEKLEKTDLAQTRVETEEKPEPKAPSKKKSIEYPERELEEILDSLDEKLDETKKTLDEMVQILEQINQERLRQTRKFFRVEATGNYFQPAEGVLHDVYENGMMYGAELDVGISNFAEFWIAEHYFGKKITEEASGVERKVTLIPLEVGLKFRLNKGIINPYLGGGAGYYQYKETRPAGDIEKKGIGFVGQAGCFFKIGDFFVVDLFVHYRYCKIDFDISESNIGGLHIGVGFGVEI